MTIGAAAASLQKPDLRSMDLDDLTGVMERMGEKPFRASQLFDWLHHRLAESPDDMNNLPKALREKLKAEYHCVPLKTVRVKESALDGTRKYLLELGDNNVIECVRMEYEDWSSVCISSQVGCAMGCRFCASTLDGCVRNLTAGEMLEEVYAISRAGDKRISNVVVMGSGEPLLNLDNLLKFIRLLTHEKGLNLSQRGITVSTCGIVPGIYALAEEKLGITLAISLHAADDETRKSLMPVASTYSLKDLMTACRDYFHKTGRRLSFEYALIDGVNDREIDAERLSKLIRGMKAHVNLIPVNPVKERNFQRSSPDSIRKFKTKLEKNGINVTIRRELGRDIDGSCGQLRRTYMEDSDKC
ncbi:MAG: 23S rRNA (adenine(2503)-C(2))-methyltransferase RlmN [Lachnospiraceae bacterium]|nr:23S rRNA (adenine(2503)-C(2))-methyltransferase RlmN [Lachnospiraceae bacterium]